jgi:hypothetical protein
VDDNKRYINTFFWLTVFSVAMGFLEGIVVVYLRNIFYNNGFDFPIQADFSRLAGVEILREAVTIIMLMSVGIIAGKNFLQRFLYFLFCFGVWDIVYYIALKILLNWPPSIFSFDILFLIPITWIAPVLAPVICSIVFIVFAIGIISSQEKGYKIKFKLINWVLFFTGSFIVFLTFIWDFASIIISGGYFCNFFSLNTDESFNKIVSTYIPAFYNWYAFAAGEVMAIFSFINSLKGRKRI